MAAFKEIKERINSIKTTRKITSAMKMVSAAKLHKAQRVISRMLPYADALNDIMRRTIDADHYYESPLVKKREIKHVALIAISSDSALVGAFNANVIRKLRQTIDNYIDIGSQNIYLYTLGKKVNEAAKKWECPIVKNYTNLSAKPDYDIMASLAMDLIGRYERGEIDKVEMIYHHFKSAGSQILMHEDLLPMTLPEPDRKGEGPHMELNYIFEPSYVEVMKELLPKSFKLRLYASLLDSNASEHAARMIAMQTATDNADELIDELTLLYNKSRQQAITNELLDIMGGQIKNGK